MNSREFADSVLKLFDKLRAFAKYGSHESFMKVCKRAWRKQNNEMNWLTQAYGSWGSLYNSARQI